MNSQASSSTIITLIIKNCNQTQIPKQIGQQLVEKKGHGGVKPRNGGLE